MKLRGIFLPLGYSCNNNCIHCFLPFSDHGTDMTTAEAKKAISAAADYGVERISLTGGEPTIRKDLFELVAFCKSLNVGMIQVQTNARMLSLKPFCSRLFSSGATEIFVSLHSHTPEVQDAITRVKGSFHQTVAGVKNIMEASRRAGREDSVFANLVVSGHNFAQLPETVRFFHGLGFPLMEIEYPRLMGNAWRFRKLIPPRPQAAVKMREAAETARSLGMGLFIDDFPVCLSEGFYDFNAYTKLGNDQVELNFSGGAVKGKGSGKMHGAVCARCSARGICEGDWEENIRFFRWDGFRPLSKTALSSAMEEVHRGHET